MEFWRVSGPIDKLEEKEVKNERLLKNFLTHECGGKGTTMDKSVLFWTRKVFGYNYGAGFRDRNPANLNNNELRANEDFETEEKEKPSES